MKTSKSRVGPAVVVTTALVMMAGAAWVAAEEPSTESPAAGQLVRTVTNTEQTPQRKPTTAPAVPSQAQPPGLEPQLKDPLTNFIKAQTRIPEVARTNGPKPEHFSGAARGRALKDLVAQADEFVASQWSQTGDAVLVSVTAVEESVKDGLPTVTITACLDSSAVAVTDINGDTVREAAEPGTRRALNIFELQQQNGRWLVAGHTFPDDADC